MITYEWVFEWVADDEIEDVEFQPNVDDFTAAQIAAAKAGPCRLALVKKSLDEVGDLDWQDYAYMGEDGTLGRGDETGFKPPKSHQTALAKKIAQSA